MEEADRVAGRAIASPSLAAFASPFTTGLTSRAPAMAPWSRCRCDGFSGRPTLRQAGVKSAGTDRVGDQGRRGLWRMYKGSNEHDRHKGLWVVYVSCVFL